MWKWFKNIFKKECPILKKVVTVPGVILKTEDVINKILKNKGMYLEVQRITGVPWDVVSAIHYRESSLDFSCHLHNGDPLDHATVHVPKGRGPFNSWEESAADALLMKKHIFPSVWNTESKLDFCERYNGLGYRNKGMPSPYVYAGTDKYVSGMYVADHKFDASKVDKRLGCAVIIKALEGK